MKLLISLFFLTISLFSAQLQILADNFNRDQQKKISFFSGHVKITKGSDELNASKVYVYVDDLNHPIKYEALGDVSFTITTDDNATYVGSAQRMLYFPFTSEYQFYTKVFLREKVTQRTLSGDKIVINTMTGNAKIVGKKKVPVRVTFEIEDENDTKKGINSTPLPPQQKDSNSTMEKVEKSLDNNITQK